MSDKEPTGLAITQDNFEQIWSGMYVQVVLNARIVKCHHFKIIKTLLRITQKDNVFVNVSVFFAFNFLLTNSIQNITF